MLHISDAIVYDRRVQVYLHAGTTQAITIDDSFQISPSPPRRASSRKARAKARKRKPGVLFIIMQTSTSASENQWQREMGRGMLGRGAMHAEFLYRPCPPPSSPQPPSLNLPVPFARVLKSISAANMTFIEKRLVPRPRRLLSFASPFNPLPRPLCFPPASNCRARCGGVGRCSEMWGGREDGTLLWQPMTTAPSAGDLRAM